MRLTNSIKQPRRPTLKWSLGEAKVYLTGGLLSVVVMLSLSGFYTLYQGLLNLVDSKVIALMTAIGLQSILFVVSWILARASAIHANGRRMRGKARREDEPKASAWFFRAVLELLLGIFAYGVARPFTVAILLVGMFESVFFSFVALSKVFNENKLLSFEGTLYLLQSGDSPTLSALFVASSIDLLVLIAAILGEHALVRHFELKVARNEKGYAELHEPRDPEFGKIVTSLEKPIEPSDVKSETFSGSRVRQSRRDKPAA